MFFALCIKFIMKEMKKLKFPSEIFPNLSSFFLKAVTIGKFIVY